MNAPCCTERTPGVTSEHRVSVHFSSRRPASAANDGGGLNEIQPREVLSQVFVAAFEQRALLAAADAAAGRLAVVKRLTSLHGKVVHPSWRSTASRAHVIRLPAARTSDFALGSARSAGTDQPRAVCCALV